MSTPLQSVDAAVTAAALATQKDVLGGEIITQTLDALNQNAGKDTSGKDAGGSKDMAASYDFQKSVLSAAYNPTGGVTDVIG